MKRHCALFLGLFIVLHGSHGVCADQLGQLFTSAAERARIDNQGAEQIQSSEPEQVVRLEGCPVSVAEQVLALVEIAGLKNPYLDPTQAVKFGRSYLGWKSRVLLNRLQNKRYQQDGTFQERGASAPELPTT